MFSASVLLRDLSRFDCWRKSEILERKNRRRSRIGLRFLKKMAAHLELPWFCMVSHILKMLVSIGFPLDEVER